MGRLAAPSEGGQAVKVCALLKVKDRAGRDVKEQRSCCEGSCFARCDGKRATHFRRYFSAKPLHGAQRRFTCRQARFTRKKNFCPSGQKLFFRVSCEHFGSISKSVAQNCATSEAVTVLKRGATEQVRTSYPCITTQQRGRDAEAKKRPVRLRDLAARRGLVPKGAFLSCAM